MSYTKAEEIRAKMRDRDAWRYGMYNYISLLKVAPILQAFAKKGTKPGEYPERPLYMEQEEKREEEMKRPVDMTEEEYLNTPEMVEKAEMVLKHLELLQRTYQIDQLNKRYESMDSDDNK